MLGIIILKRLNCFIHYSITSSKITLIHYSKENNEKRTMYTFQTILERSQIQIKNHKQIPKIQMVILIGKNLIQLTSIVMCVVATIF